jgi:hypothetical protein
MVRVFTMPPGLEDRRPLRPVPRLPIRGMSVARFTRECTIPRFAQIEKTLAFLRWRLADTAPPRRAKRRLREGRETRSATGRGVSVGDRDLPGLRPAADRVPAAAVSCQR